MQNINRALQWSKEDLVLLEKKLNVQNFEFFKKFCKDFQDLEQQLFNKVPSETTVTLMKKSLPSFYTIESKFFHFNYSYFYKLRNFVNALKFGFTQRNFLTVVCIARSMLETSCCQLYFIDKIDRQMRKLSKPNEVTSEAIARVMFQIVSELDQSHTGTSFEWETHLANGFIPKTKKQLHINDPLRLAEKVTTKPIQKYYSLLSEMTHPNFGSNLLVIESRGRENNDLFELVLGDGIGSESLLFFFDNLAETLSVLMQISLQAINSSNNNAAYFTQLTELGDKR